MLNHASFFFESIILDKTFYYKQKIGKISNFEVVDVGVVEMVGWD